MDSNEAIKFAGDVSIDRVRIITSKGFAQDITQQTIGIEYFEDLFSPFVTGHLIIKDALDLVGLFPLMGEEYVELEFQTPTMDSAIRGQYYIHKMSDRIITGDRTVVYELHFVSTELVVDLNKRISKTYKGKISDTVRSILTDTSDGLETTKQLFIEETSNSKTFVSPYWMPSKCISYCADIASNLREVPSFLFFENKDGFHFETLDKLYSEPKIQDFTHDKYTRDEIPGGGSAMNIIEDYKRVLDLTIPMSFDYIDQIKSGALGSTATTFNVTEKTYTEKTFNMFSVFQKQNHLNANPIHSGSVILKNNSALFHRNRQLANFSGTGFNSNFITLQERASILKIANAHCVELTVPGRTDYTVGKKVELNLNKMQPIHDDDEIQDVVDRMYSGNYLISAINHSVTRERHECHMELIKDSVMFNPNAEGTN